MILYFCFFFFQAEDGIRDGHVTGVQTCALLISSGAPLGAALLRIFALQLPLYGISVVLGAYLHARKRFLWPAMMPLISSLVVMVSYRIYAHLVPPVATIGTIGDGADRKSTRLNSSHVAISYAV